MRNQQDKKLSFIQALIPCVTLIAIVLFAASAMLHSYIDIPAVTKALYGSDCDFEVPEGYKIVYSKVNNDYAVRALQYPGLYISVNGFLQPEDMYKELSAPTTFNDSCCAKAFLKAYLKRINSMDTYK